MLHTSEGYKIPSCSLINETVVIICIISSNRKSKRAEESENASASSFSVSLCLHFLLVIVRTRQETSEIAKSNIASKSALAKDEIEIARIVSDTSISPYIKR